MYRFYCSFCVSRWGTTGSILGGCPEIAKVGYFMVCTFDSFAGFSGFTLQFFQTSEMAEVDDWPGNLGKELLDLHMSLVKSSGGLLVTKHTPIVLELLGSSHQEMVEICSLCASRCIGKYVKYCSERDTFKNWPLLEYSTMDSTTTCLHDNLFICVQQHRLHVHLCGSTK